MVYLDGEFWMTFAFRPFAWNSYPTGLGVPNSSQAEYADFDGDPMKNQTRSGLARSVDGLNWKFHGWVNDTTVDDRNVILFPGKVGGKYVVLRRPQPFVGTDTGHGDFVPSVQISYSEDLLTWTAPEPIFSPRFTWEDNRIGGSTPPILTDAGWLVFYHGVENHDPQVRGVTYRMGAVILDREDPRTVLARSPVPLLEPETYYEKTGLYIPNVVFPTGAIVRGGNIYLYYGVCDTAIALATVSLDSIVEFIMQHPNYS